MTIICITDGTETVESQASTITAAMAEYAATYGFNEAGDVECTAYAYRDEDAADERDYDEMVEFTIRSDDGRRGYLIDAA